MKSEKIRTKAEYTKLLVNDYLDQEKYLQEHQKQFLYSITRRYKYNRKGLFQLYEAIYNKKEAFYDEDAELSYQCQGKEYIFENKGKNVVFEYQTVKEVLGKLIDLTEDVLPIGTLVQLKKEYFAKIFDVQKVKKVWIVITHRYLKMDDSSYFTYGGVVYPISNFNRQEILKFTPALIEKVIHTGYSDEQEDAYVYLMKKKLTIEDGQKSAGVTMGG